MKPIASAKLFVGQAKGPRRRVEFRVFAPEPDPKSKFRDCRCRVHVKGLGRPRWVYGVDSLQALGLAFCLIKAEVKTLKSKKLNLYHSLDDNEPTEFIFAYFGDLRDFPRGLKRGIAKAKRVANKSRDTRAGLRQNR